MRKIVLFIAGSFIVLTFLSSCNHSDAPKPITESEVKTTPADTAEYYLFRPKLEKEYGYSHAVKIGDDLKISGAVSMDDNGVIVAPGSMEQQMKNCYGDLEKILKHYGYSFDDIYEEKGQLIEIDMEAHKTK